MGLTSIIRVFLLKRHVPRLHLVETSDTPMQRTFGFIDRSKKVTLANQPCFAFSVVSAAVLKSSGSDAANDAKVKSLSPV